MQVRVLSGVLMWCQTNRLEVIYLGKKSFPKKMRCSSCKKNICLFVRECDDEGCYHLYMPAHKKPVKKKKKTSKDTFFKR